MNILDTLNDEDQDAGVKPVNGVVTGIVSNNKDPDGLGRVKVRINVFEDKHETGWAPVAALMAGSGRGSFFLPEVGDEVLMAFEHGNINAPYVVGALWNGKARPPETNSDGKNNIRKFTSRSGHEIVFGDDSEGKKEKLEIKTNGGHKIVLDDAQGKENVTIKSKAGHKVVLADAPGKEKIEIADKTGSNKMMLDSVKKEVSIESAMKLSIKAKVIEIKGETSLTLSSDAMLTVKGSMVKIN